MQKRPFHWTLGNATAIGNMSRVVRDNDGFTPDTAWEADRTGIRADAHVARSPISKFL